MTDLSIAAIDIDGAVQESAEAAGYDTRSAFFRKGLTLGGGMLAAGAFGGASCRRSPALPRPRATSRSSTSR